jgi:hypothetical protein
MIFILVIIYFIAFWLYKKDTNIKYKKFFNYLYNFSGAITIIIVGISTALIMVYQSDISNNQTMILKSQRDLQALQFLSDIRIIRKQIEIPEEKDDINEVRTYEEMCVNNCGFQINEMDVSVKTYLKIFNEESNCKYIELENYFLKPQKEENACYFKNENNTEKTDLYKSFILKHFEELLDDSEISNDINNEYAYEKYRKILEYIDSGSASQETESEYNNFSKYLSNDNEDLDIDSIKTYELFKDYLVSKKSSEEEKQEIDETIKFEIVHFVTTEIESIFDEEGRINFSDNIKGMSKQKLYWISNENKTESIGEDYLENENNEIIKLDINVKSISEESEKNIKSFIDNNFDFLTKPLVKSLTLK